MTKTSQEMTALRAWIAYLKAASPTRAEMSLSLEEAEAILNEDDQDCEKVKVAVRLPQEVIRKGGGWRPRGRG